MGALRAALDPLCGDLKDLKAVCAGEQTLGGWLWGCWAEMKPEKYTRVLNAVVRRAHYVSGGVGGDH